MVRITKDLDSGLDGKDVILIEDTIDSEMTLNYLVDYLRSKNQTSQEVCTLLDKPVRRIVDVPIKYVGFELPDEFVVGYGLDYEGTYRNMPFTAAVGG